MKSLAFRGCPLIFLAAVPLCAQGDGFSASLHEGAVYESTGGNLKLRLGGRFHLDAALFYEDKARLQDDLRVRRARFSLRADLYRDWRLRLEYDLADEEERYSSLWLRYSGYDKTHITAGQFQEPFGLEESTSSNATLFMEHSLANALAPGTNVGFGLVRWDDQWSASGGFFWETYIEDANPFASREGRGASARLTLAPLAGETWVAHLGLSASRRLPQENDRLRFHTRPESELTEVRFIDSGVIRHVDDYVTGGIEAAAMAGPFLIQGEYLGVSVERNGGHSDVDFSGGYLAASYLLRGKQRRYSVSSGTFGTVRIENGSAWELVFRRSFLDLNSGGIRGGAQLNTSWGVNWYPHEHVRLMFNYIQVDTDESAGNDDPVILQARLQLAI